MLILIVILLCIIVLAILVWVAGTMLGMGAIFFGAVKHRKRPVPVEPQSTQAQRDAVAAAYARAAERAKGQ
jgi:hypothetical protein